MERERFSKRYRVLIPALVLVLALGVVAEAFAPAVMAADRIRHVSSSATDFNPEALAELEALAAKTARSDVETEVVGGAPVRQGTHSFMAKILVSFGGGSFSNCGGSLIDPQYVLTAAHCIMDLETGEPYALEQYFVIVGKAFWPDYDENANLRRVINVTWRTDFDPVNNGTLAYDVAVLKLNAPIFSSVATPIRFVNGGETSFNGIGRTVTVAGWGRTSGNGDGSEQLLSANLKTVSSAECGGWWGNQYLPGVMICATYVGRTACKGDSGGPLFTNEVVGQKVKRKKSKRGKGRIKRNPVYAPVQIGIVSFGEPSCPPGVPSVYTRVSSSGVNDVIDFALEN